MERNSEISYITDDSVRIKVNNDCQWTCTFCHNEGTELPANQTKRSSVFLDYERIELPTVGNMPSSVEVLDQVSELQSIGITNVHLTGGEPTLHPDIVKIVSSLTERGFNTKMTSNGQTRPRIIEDLANAGLSGITFSILSLDPKEFLKTQHIQSEQWAQMMIDREKRNILLARDLGIDVKINTVVLGEFDYPRVDTVRKFAQENGIKLVLLPSLEDKEESQPAVFDYAEKHGTEVGGFEHPNNSKGSRSYSSPEGSKFDAKYIREYHPDVICNGCELRGTNDCYEKFYGIRMEFRENSPYIRLCIQKTNEKTVMPLETFLEEDIISQL
jgi:cyclic pyranopterin phosphate synthase